MQGANIDAGQLPENIHKNRYRDILPYEVSNFVFSYLMLIIISVPEPICAISLW